MGSVERRGISGGQRKRVSVALELLTRPSVLFLDEPTSGLDSKAAEDVCSMLAKIALQGHTVVCTNPPAFLEAFRSLPVARVVVEG